MALMAEEKPITIFIAEDHEITRVGLRLTLEQVPDFRIIGEADDGGAAVNQIQKLKPDIVLMDIGMPTLDGIEATQQIKRNDVGSRVIVLTSHDNDKDVFAALGAGADGYCLKEISSTQLANAIRTVSDGAAWLDPGVASRVFRAAASLQPSSGGSARGGGGGQSPLSSREVDVLRLVVEGMSNQEIAEALHLSVETIKTHMRHIMEKLAVTDRTQAAVKAMREGLV